MIYFNLAYVMWFTSRWKNNSTWFSSILTLILKSTLISTNTVWPSSRSKFAVLFRNFCTKSSLRLIFATPEELFTETSSPRIYLLITTRGLRLLISDSHEHLASRFELLLTRSRLYGNWHLKFSLTDNLQFMNYYH